MRTVRFVLNVFGYKMFAVHEFEDEQAQRYIDAGVAVEVEEMTLAPAEVLRINRASKRAAKRRGENVETGDPVVDKETPIDDNPEEETD